MTAIVTCTASVVGVPPQRIRLALITSTSNIKAFGKMMPSEATSPHLPTFMALYQADLPMLYSRKILLWICMLFTPFCAH